jgi:hypothetical protein
MFAVHSARKIRFNYLRTIIQSRIFLARRDGEKLIGIVSKFVCYVDVIVSFYLSTLFNLK